MPDPISITTSAKAIGIRAAKWAWDHQDEIEPRLKRFYYQMRRRILGRQPGILILGPGGTGKTTLAQILSGKYEFMIDSDRSYHQTVGVQTFRSRKNYNVELVVGPGQEDRRDATWPNLLKRLANGKELGIIHCCAYGYHSLSISYKHHKAYKPQDPAGFLDDFTRQRRDDELHSLQRIAQALEQAPNQVWLLTLVAKEDLWTSQDAAARDFYANGPYAQQVQNLLHAKGNRLFRHELVFASLVIQNLTTTRGELLQPNSVGYDHPRQVQSLRQLIETVASLQEWKAK